MKRSSRGGGETSINDGKDVDIVIGKEPRNKHEFVTRKAINVKGSKGEGEGGKGDRRIRDRA
jgi:hypothetical protein